MKRGNRYILTVWHFAILILGFFNDSYVYSLNDDDCIFHDLTPAVSAVLCAVERRVWVLASNSSAITDVGCLLGNSRCDSVRHTPTESEIPPSELPPAAKNKQYQVFICIFICMYMYIYLHVSMCI
jgi:hypothetical protein